MRKQTKLAVVLAAAALLAVGSASLVSAGWVQDGAEWRYQNSSGDYVTEEIKKSGDVSFYLDENGYMAKDYFLNDYGDNNDKYYFAANGAMVKNTWVAIDPALTDCDDENLDVAWFYFQDTGKAVKASDQNGTKKKKIDGKTYFFDEDGVMLTGWFGTDGDRYNPDDDDEFLDEADYYAGEDGVARSGWLTYASGVDTSYYIGNDEISDKSVMYFWFDPSTFKKKKGQPATKTLNGKKYAFNEFGIMYSGWEMSEDVAKGTDKTGGTAQDDVWADSTNRGVAYFSAENDGHMVKKGWVYAVPSAILNSSKNDDDEEKYFYFNLDGTMVAGIEKKINSKYYVFAKDGIMKTGLVILDSANKFKDIFDLDKTNGEYWIKRNTYTSDMSGKSVTYDLASTTDKIHYYGSDGARITGSKTPIEFTDDTYYFASDNAGGYKRYTKKKYYSNGFLLKANSDIKYGIVLASDAGARKSFSAGIPYYADIINHGTSIVPSAEEWTYITASLSDAGRPYNDALDLVSSKSVIDNLWNYLYVVTTSGSVKTKSVKDGDGNYWLINPDGKLLGIYNCDVRFNKFSSNDKSILNCRWHSDTLNGWVETPANVAADNFEAKASGWYRGAYKTEKDENGVGYPVLVDEIEDHRVKINDDYCLNFTLTDRP